MPRSIVEVDLRTRPMGPQNPERAQGGFIGVVPGRPSPVVLTDVERREQDSVRILEEAKIQADSIVREAEALHKGAEGVQREAWQAGFEQGERAGEKLGQQKVEPVLQSFHDLMNSIGLERANVIQSSEKELIKIAFMIATQLLKTTLELQPEVITEVVTSALARIPERQQVSVCINPEDKAVIDRWMSLGHSFNWPPEQIEFVADASIARGGCLIKAEQGDIDSALDRQLEVVRQSLWPHPTLETSH